MIPQSIDHKKYTALYMKEIEGLPWRRVLMLTSFCNAHIHRIYDWRFVNYFKHEGILRHIISHG